MNKKKRLAKEIAEKEFLSDATQILSLAVHIDWDYAIELSKQQLKTIDKDDVRKSAENFINDAKIMTEARKKIKASDWRRNAKGK